METEKSKCAKKTIQYILEQEDSSDEEEERQEKINGLTKKQKDKIIENLQIMVDNEFKYSNIFLLVEKLIFTGSFYCLLTEIFG